MADSSHKVRDINDLLGRVSLLLRWALERENKEKRREEIIKERVEGHF